jgi:hypothetical protein
MVSTLGDKKQQPAQGEKEMPVRSAVERLRSRLYGKTSRSTSARLRPIQTPRSLHCPRYGFETDCCGRPVLRLQGRVRTSFEDAGTRGRTRSDAWQRSSSENSLLTRNKMGQLTIPGTSIQYSNPEQVPQASLVTPGTTATWQPALTLASAPAPGGGTGYGYMAIPKPQSFDATKPQANLVVFLNPA